MGKLTQETQFWDLIGRVQNQIGGGLQSLEQRQLGDLSKALVTEQPLLTEGDPRGDEGHPSPQGQSYSLLVSQALLFHNPHGSQTEQTGLALIPTRKDCLSTQLTTASTAENKRCQILPEELSHGWRPRGQCSRLVGSRPGQRDRACREAAV